MMIKKCSFLVFNSFFNLLIFIFSLKVSALTELKSVKNKNPFPVKYISEIDQKLTLKTITLAPVYDNVNHIYAEPIQKLLVELLQSDKTIGYTEFVQLEKNIFIESYDTKPEEVLSLLVKSKAQGLLAAIITKGPHGLNAKLNYTQMIKVCF